MGAQFRGVTDLHPPDPVIRRTSNIYIYIFKVLSPLLHFTRIVALALVADKEKTFSELSILQCVCVCVCHCVCVCRCVCARGHTWHAYVLQCTCMCQSVHQQISVCVLTFYTLIILLETLSLLLLPVPGFVMFYYIYIYSMHFLKTN